jgi:hypothetical protein
MLIHLGHFVTRIWEQKTNPKKKESSKGLLNLFEVKCDA